jgi:RNA polymerase sigma-70 factor (ECF subfamily)
MSDARVPIDDLLAHRAWVRAVARAIARGDADADDLEQDAWVAAVEGPPRHDASLRGWFRGVLRRRAAMRVRGDVRRDGRERATARPEDGSRAADDLVTEAESHARVAQAVVALDEPFRTAILLRYFEGLPPRDVAARTDVPVETARSRIKRGVALLRASLGGDDDERAALLVAPLLRVPHGRIRPIATTTAAATGGIAMALGTKLVAATAVLVGVAAAWWTLHGENAPIVATTSHVAVVAPASSTAKDAPRSRNRGAAAVADTDESSSSNSAATPTSTGRTIRWRVVGGEVPIPPPGSVLAVERDRGAMSLPAGMTGVRVDGDDLVAEGVGRGTVQGYAVAPDGARAKLFAKDGDARGADTSFLRERSIEVTLVEPNGSPAVGVALQLRNQGNNVIRSGVQTDAGGRAVFAGLSPDAGLLDVVIGASPYMNRWLGTLNTKPGDVHVTWTVPAARDVTLRVSVDGERRIPPKCGVSTSEASVDDRQDDDARGDIRLRLRPDRDGAEIRAAIGAEGRTSAFFTVPAGHDPATVDVAIPRGVTFVGHILPPGDLLVRVNPLQPPRTGPSVVFERRYDRDGTWNRCMFSPPTRAQEGTPPGADGMFRFGPLPLGAYRLRDAATGATSAVAELVEDGAESSVCVLDLSRAGLVRGSVEIDGGDLRDARVIVEGVPDPVSGDAKRRTVVVSGKGNFEAWIPGDRAVRVRAEHPFLRPDPSRGFVDVVRPTDDVVLALVPGPTLAFRLPGTPTPDHGPSPHVLFFRGEPFGEPATKRDALPVDDALRVGGFEPGTWTLVIDANASAPKTLRGVVLGEGDTDLGDVALDAGLSLRVRIATFPNEVAPRIGVTVSRKDGAEFWRSKVSNGESDVVVSGLVPGTYEVFCYPQTGSIRSDFMKTNDPPYLRKTVVVDASGETVIDYSQR